MLISRLIYPFQTNDVEQLRQQNYIVMASFSYILRILSFHIFAIFLFWISSPCFLDMCPLCVFAVWALNTFGNKFAQHDIYLET